MTPADRERLVAQVAAVGEIYGVSLSSVGYELWVDMVGDLDYAAVVEALRAHARQSPYMPKPADIVRQVEVSAEDAALAAWGRVLAEVRRVGWCGTPALPAADLAGVQAVWGSWRALCETLPVGGPERLGWQTRFVAAYALQGREATHQALTATAARARLADLTRRGMPEGVP